MTKLITPNDVTYFLWLSVSVIPWLDTLKWTWVVLAGGLSKVTLQALATACGPVRDSVSTELRYITLHAEIEIRFSSPSACFLYMFVLSFVCYSCLTVNFYFFKKQTYFKSFDHYHCRHLLYCHYHHHLSANWNLS